MSTFADEIPLRSNRFMKTTQAALWREVTALPRCKRSGLMHVKYRGIIAQHEDRVS